MEPADTCLCTGPCGLEKPVDLFYSNPSRKNGLSSMCKECQKKYLAEYRARPGNRDKHVAYCKAYWEQNKEEMLASSKEYNDANKEAISAQVKTHREQNSETILARERRGYHRDKHKHKARRKAYRKRTKAHVSEKNKAYREQNREALNAYTKQWRKDNPEKVRELNRASAGRLSLDPLYRVVRNLRRALHAYLTRVDAIKAGRIIELVGCTKAELVMHLQNQFREGMSWNNYGPVWHVDHIRPCASFDMTDPEQQKACFRWSNLQPLFAQENMSKGARYNAS